MKKLLLLTLFFIPMVSCLDTDRFKNLGLPVDTALPVGKYGITSEKVFGEMMGIDVTVSSSDGVLELVYANDGFSALGPDEIAGWLEIDNQDVQAGFDLSPITGSLPAGFHPITIDQSNAEVFTSRASLNFKQDVKPAELLLKGGAVRVEATTDMPTSGLFVMIPQIRRDGKPMYVNLGKRQSLDGYVLAPTNENGTPEIDVMVVGSSEISATSSLSVNVYIEDVRLKEFKGYLGRQVSSGTTTVSVEISSIFDKVETFYPGDIFVDLGVDNTFEALPMLLVLKKLTFVSRSDPAKNVEVALKNGLGSDRFFLGKGKTHAVIGNANTVSGKGISDAVSRSADGILVEFEVITNPTDADALGQVEQEDYNILNADVEIASTMDVKVPLKGYMKGMSVEESMALDIDFDKLEAATIQYNMTAVNSFPMNVGISLMLIDRATGNVLFEEPNPIKIDGNSELKFSNENIKAISSADAVDKLLNGQADMHVKLTGETVGADSQQVVSFTNDDRLDLQLFLGVNGVYIIKSEEKK